MNRDDERRGRRLLRTDAQRKDDQDPEAEISRVRSLLRAARRAQRGGRLFIVQTAGHDVVMLPLQYELTFVPGPDLLQ